MLFYGCEKYRYFNAIRNKSEPRNGAEAPFPGKQNGQLLNDFLEPTSSENRV